MGMVVLTMSSAAVADADARRAEARDLARQGDVAFSQGRCDKAIPLWKRAEDTFHAPTILLRMARCEALLGHVVDATATLEQIVAEKLEADAPPPWREAQRDAADELPGVRARVASLEVSVAGGEATDARVSIDDADAVAGTPIPLDPGSHRLRASAGDAAWAEEVRLAEGESRVVRLTVRREPPRTTVSRIRPVGFAVGAAGLASIAVGAVVFGAPALGNAKDLDGVCGADRQKCPLDRQPDIDRVKTRALVADVWMGVGGALLLTGAVLVLATPAPKKEGPRFRIGPMGAGAQVLGAF
jgi:hypothetical protein